MENGKPQGLDVKSSDLDEAETDAGIWEVKLNFPDKERLVETPQTSEYSQDCARQFAEEVLHASVQVVMKRGNYRECG